MFNTTHWSLVIRAGGESSGAAGALETLCERYWFPLFAYARRRGVGPEEAQDLTQGFFARLLEKNALSAATPERGRFRSFLLASFKNFLSNEADRDKAARRGGGAKLLSLDFRESESRLALQPAHELTAEKVFERQWALTLLEHVVARLKQEFDDAGKVKQFEVLKPAISGQELSDDAGRELGLSAAALRQAAHRLRKRYREILREEVAHTVESPADVDAELAALFEAL